MASLTPIALDIETTGFTASDAVTVLGVALPEGCRVFCQTGGRDADATRIERALEARVETTVRLSVHADETELLAAVGTFGRETLAAREYLLVAYNGDCWKGGFDLPFLRTRYATADAAWPFAALPYADLLPVVRKRFNTTPDSHGDGDADGTEASNTLETAYETLVDGPLTATDPLADSGQAVAAFEGGAFEDLTAHNLADILRTRALARLAEQYCGKSEFQLKSLTPVAQARLGGDTRREGTDQS